MDSEILKKILEDTHNLYDEIHKNSNIISELLNVDCINYNIKNEDIDEIKKVFIENIDIFINFLSQVLFSDIESYTFEQLIDILKWDNMSIFTIKNLHNKQIKMKLEETEKEIYLYCYNRFKETFTYNKLEFFAETEKNIYIKQFIQKMIEYNQNDKIVDTVDTVDTVKFNENEIENIKNIISEYKSDKLDIIELTELKYTLWNNNVLLYEFRNKKTYDYIYVYIDFSNKDNIIEMEINKKYCILVNTNEELRKNIKNLINIIF